MLYLGPFKLLSRIWKQQWLQIRQATLKLNLNLKASGCMKIEQHLCQHYRMTVPLRFDNIHCVCYSFSVFMYYWYVFSHFSIFTLARLFVLGPMWFLITFEELWFCQTFISGQLGMQWYSAWTGTGVHMYHLMLKDAFAVVAAVGYGGEDKHSGVVSGEH